MQSENSWRLWVSVYNTQLYCRRQHGRIPGLLLIDNSTQSCHAYATSSGILLQLQLERPLIVTIALCNFSTDRTLLYYVLFFWKNRDIEFLILLLTNYYYNNRNLDGWLSRQDGLMYLYKRTKPQYELPRSTTILFGKHDFMFQDIMF